jgi:hypothetical protein
MEKVFLIVFKESKTVEAVIQNLSDFPKWLNQHNQDRGMDFADDDFVEETEDDFELISVSFYKY